ncbi:hypothetical protein G5S52_09365 [Grimontia sp. S25]|uniref:Uncharacterized protein n=1 Tax=Grimontia sedimenti TaxID=2711294 RepID=A0A6M1RJF8_9GAMM|nr:hypothetical protein [Grimontia sedimenti]NGN97858.1 hypothetical protein [Grimontia sedimenti]
MFRQTSSRKEAHGQVKAKQSSGIDAAVFSIQSQAFELELSGFGSPVLAEQGCSYGRGKLAVESAQAQAADNLRSVLQSTNLLSSAKRSESFDDSVFSDKNIEAIATGLANGTMVLDFSDPEILGDDTCVTARLPLDAPESFEGDDIDWEEDTTKSIIVSGEGLHDKVAGLTARQVAEQDALRRAISQVLGVVIKSALSSSSSSELYLTESNESLKSAEMVRQSLSMSSHGTVKSWSEISSKSLPGGMIEVTLNVEVEKSGLEAKLKEAMQRIGNPNIFVVSEHANVRYHLTQALTSSGMTVTASPESASLLLVADAKPSPSKSGTRLQLDLSIKDRLGNNYGQWRNDPSLIALPSHDDVLSTLAEVYLQSENNQVEIRQTIQKASHALVQAGGPIREISIANHIAGDHSKLHAVLSSLADVSDVKVSKGKNSTLVRLRSINSLGELSHLLSPAMKVHTDGKAIQLTIHNDYQLSML